MYTAQRNQSAKRKPWRQQRNLQLSEVMVEEGIIDKPREFFRAVKLCFMIL